MILTNTALWSFNRIGDDCWVNDLCDTKEEAETIGRTWAKKCGFSAFAVGKCECTPFRQKLTLTVCLKCWTKIILMKPKWTIMTFAHIGTVGRQKMRNAENG